MKRSGLVFLADVNGFVHNSALFFRGIDLSIGNVTVSYPYQQYYVQQKLSKMGRKKLEEYANGMCLQLSPSD